MREYGVIQVTFPQMKILGFVLDYSFVYHRGYKVFEKKKKKIIINHNSVYEKKFRIIYLVCTSCSSNKWHYFVFITVLSREWMYLLWRIIVFLLWRIIVLPLMMLLLEKHHRCSIFFAAVSAANWISIIIIMHYWPKRIRGIGIICCCGPSGRGNYISRYGNRERKFPVTAFSSSRRPIVTRGAGHTQ